MSDTPGRSLPPVNAPGASAARPSVIQLVFREKSALYAAYMALKNILLRKVSFPHRDRPINAQHLDVTGGELLHESVSN